MIEVTVTVSGPGRCINSEMQVIEAALLKAGATVTVMNKHSDGLLKNADCSTVHVTLVAGGG
jgi:hypothetical protein